MPHNFFIHSFVDGHLDCFHILVIVNIAAINIAVQVGLGYHQISVGKNVEKGNPRALLVGM